MPATRRVCSLSVSLVRRPTGTERIAISVKPPPSVSNCAGV
jgi:hypothetical protein